MEKNINNNNTIATINSANNSTSLLEKIAPTPTKKMEDGTTAAEARANFFAVYPEAAKVYADICGDNPLITFDKKWLNNESGKRIIGFINFVKYMGLDEIFPNWDALVTAASITDGGTINRGLEAIVEFLALRAPSLARHKEDPIATAMQYREIAQWVINNNKIDTFFDKDCGVIQSACAFCEIDYKTIEDAVKTEISLRTFLIK